MERRALFIQLRAEGWKLQQIAKAHNITHQRVSAILSGNIKKKKYIKFRSEEETPKSYLDYLKASDYSDRVKKFYIKDYGNKKEDNNC